MNFNRRVILGMPFDGGSKLPGARFGPSYILDYVKRTTPDFLSRFSEADILPLDSILSDISLTLARRKVSQLLEEGKQILTIGGDHTVTIPILEAYKKSYDKFKVFHLDAHSDAYAADTLEHFSICYKMKELQLDIVAVGVRFGLDALDTLNIPTLPASALFESNIENELTKYVDKDAFAYISIDVDVLDPSFAYGVSSPEGGGLSTRELLRVLSMLFRMNVIGVDIVEYNPLRDLFDRTLVPIMAILRLIDREWKH